MTRFAFAAALVFSLAALAPAQDGEGQPPPPPEGRARMFRGDGGPGGPGGPGFMGGGRMIGRLAEDLELDEEQRATFDEIMGKAREQMQSMGERWRDVRRLQESGDEAGATALREQLMQNRGFENVMTDAIAQLEPILRPEQLEKLDTMRDRMERDQQGRDAYRRVMTELPDRLELDDSQREQFNTMVEKSRQQMGERFQAMRPLFEQMREAREAGDTARVEELRKEMEAQRPDMDAQYAEFYTQLEGVLRDDQKQKLAEFRDEVGMGTGGEAGETAGSADAREILRMAKRVRMTDQQRDEFKNIERDAMRDYRQARRDEQAKTALAEKVKQDLLKLFDEEQAERFNAQLERLERRSRKG